MPRPPRRRDFTVGGWVGEYWLASSAELRRLVTSEPDYRQYGDRHQLRWALISDTATEVLCAARAKVGDDWSPDRLATWDVAVTVETPEPLKSGEAWVVESLFCGSESPATDWWTGAEDVTNGRHRMWFAGQSGAAKLPVQSRVASDWSFGLYGSEDCTTLREQTWSCAYLHQFVGACSTWRRRRGADRDFVDGLAFAIDVAARFLEDVTASAGTEPRMLPRS